MSKVFLFFVLFNIVVTNPIYAESNSRNSSSIVANEKTSSFSNEIVKIEILKGYIEDEYVYLTVKVSNLGDKNKSLSSLIREIDVLQEDENSVYELSKDYSKTRKHDKESYEKLDVKLKPNGTEELTVVYKKKISNDKVFIRNDDEDDSSFEYVIEK